ncbi:MAG: hypothetical protein ABJ056_05715 [Halioglobus sp.]
MVIKIDALGAPEQGMSRAEILDYSSSMLEASLSVTDLFYTPLFVVVLNQYELLLLRQKSVPPLLTETELQAQALN